MGISDGVGITVDAAIANGRDWRPEAVDVFRIVAANETVGMGRIRHRKQSRGIGKAKVEVSLPFCVASGRIGQWCAPSKKSNLRLFWRSHRAVYRPQRLHLVIVIDPRLIEQAGRRLGKEGLACLRIVSLYLFESRT